MSPRLRSLPATAWVTLQHIAEQALWLLLFAIQAPVLGPKPFGLISIVMVFVGFCEYVVASVATEVLLSIREISPRHYSTVTATCLAISAALGLVMFLEADRLAQVFQDQQVAAIARALAFLPVLSALASAPAAAIKRDMHFRGTAVRGVTSLVIAGSVSLGLTLGGAGVWALVAQALLQRMVSAVVLWKIAPMRFALSWSWSCLREMRRLAGKLALSCVMNWSSGQLPRLILGLWLGLVDLGLFSLASRLVDILTQVAIDPKTTVARVYLREFFQDPEGLRTVTRRMIEQLSIICFPLCVGGAAVVPTLFHVWLDARWTGAIVPAQLLLLTGIPTVTFYCTTAVLLALNKQGSEALIATTQTVSIALVAVAFAPFGLLAVTIAFALRPWVLAPLPITFLLRRAPLGFGVVVGAQALPLALASLMGASVWGLRTQLESHVGAAPLLAILVGAGVVIYAALLLLAMPRLISGFTRRPGAAAHIVS
jgi:O-antigen/teichoic acid export membrane protein